ncbi:hypothetical protein AJ80_05583 [Polytolypa hystricis UAMH7299]|uniref:Uncharacterized protein n=1 Tax=Polytolypa hystricis (strain UAMH7299) TaxID=1447883 RepID=A0A2B7Y2P5_POLH7|nr:hypothetical protein AJ80_05583 [Polytolypa hystricis UAMH7299]
MSLQGEQDGKNYDVSTPDDTDDDRRRRLHLKYVSPETIEQIKHHGFPPPAPSPPPQGEPRSSYEHPPAPNFPQAWPTRNVNYHDPVGSRDTAGHRSSWLRGGTRRRTMDNNKDNPENPRPTKPDRDLHNRYCPGCAVGDDGAGHQPSRSREDGDGNRHRPIDNNRNNPHRDEPDPKDHRARDACYDHVGGPNRAGHPASGLRGNDDDDDRRRTTKDNRNNPHHDELDPKAHHAHNPHYDHVGGYDRSRDRPLRLNNNNDDGYDNQRRAKDSRGNPRPGKSDPRRPEDHRKRSGYALVPQMREDRRYPSEKSKEAQKRYETENFYAVYESQHAYTRAGMGKIESIHGGGRGSHMSGGGGYRGPPGDESDDTFKDTNSPSGKPIDSYYEDDVDDQATVRAEDMTGHTKSHSSKKENHYKGHGKGGRGGSGYQRQYSDKPYNNSSDTRRAAPRAEDTTEYKRSSEKNHPSVPKMRRMGGRSEMRSRWEDSDADDDPFSLDDTPLSPKSRRRTDDSLGARPRHRGFLSPEALHNPDEEEDDDIGFGRRRGPHGRGYRFDTPGFDIGRPRDRPGFEDDDDFEESYGRSDRFGGRDFARGLARRHRPGLEDDDDYDDGYDEYHRGARRRNGFSDTEDMEDHINSNNNDRAGMGFGGRGHSGMGMSSRSFSEDWEGPRRRGPDARFSTRGGRRDYDDDFAGSYGGGRGTDIYDQLRDIEREYERIHCIYGDDDDELYPGGHRRGRSDPTLQKMAFVERLKMPDEAGDDPFVLESTLISPKPRRPGKVLLGGLGLGSHAGHPLSQGILPPRTPPCPDEGEPCRTPPFPDQGEGDSSYSQGILPPRTPPCPDEKDSRFDRDASRGQGTLPPRTPPCPDEGEGNGFDNYHHLTHVYRCDDEKAMDGPTNFWVRMRCDGGCGDPGFGGKLSRGFREKGYNDSREQRHCSLDDNMHCPIHGGVSGGQGIGLQPGFMEHHVY